MIRPLGDGDVDWAEALLEQTLGGRMQARRGALIDALGDDGLPIRDELELAIRLR